MADVAPEENEPVAEVALLGGGGGRRHRFFGLQRILLRFGVETEPAAYPYAVCVGDDPGFAEYIPEQEVGYLPADPREGQKRFHGVGELSAVPVLEKLTFRLYVGSLDTVKAAGADDIFYFRKLGVGERP